MNLGLKVNLEINATKITNPVNFNVNIIEIDGVNGSTIMASGKHVRDIVATKREIGITFNALSWDKCSELLTLLGEPFFNLTYPDPVTGIYETKEFFVKDKSVPFAVEYKDELYWDGLSMTLKER